MKRLLACHSLSRAILLLRQRKKDLLCFLGQTTHPFNTYTHSLSYTHTHTYKCTLSSTHTQAHSLCHTQTHTQNQAFEPQTEGGYEKPGQSMHCLVGRKQQSRAEGNADKSPASSPAVHLGGRCGCWAAPPHF